MTERRILGIKIPSLLPKEGYSVFKYLSTPKSGQREEAAKQAWSDLSQMPDFDPRVRRGQEQLNEGQRIPFEE